MKIISNKSLSVLLIALAMQTSAEASSGRMRKIIKYGIPASTALTGGAILGLRTVLKKNLDPEYSGVPTQKNRPDFVSFYDIGFGDNAENHRRTLDVVTRHKGKWLEAETSTYNFADVKMFEEISNVESQFKRIGNHIDKMEEKREEIEKINKKIQKTNHRNEFLQIRNVERFQNEKKKALDSRAKAKTKMIKKGLATVPMLLKLARCARSISIGSMPDVEIAMQPAVECFKYHVPFGFFGHSRGGKVAIRKAHTIYYPEKYKAFWKKMGLSINEVKTMRSLLKKLWVGNPFVDIRPIFRKMSKGVADAVVSKILDEEELEEKEKEIDEQIEDSYFFTRPLKKLWLKHVQPLSNTSIVTSCEDLVSKPTLIMATDFSYFFVDQEIDLIEDLAKKGLPIDITLVNPEDEILGNANDEKMLKIGEKYENVEVRKVNDHHCDLANSFEKYKSDVVHILKKIQDEKDHLEIVDLMPDGESDSDNE